MHDIIVLLPGITGSVLRKDGETIWGVSASTVIGALSSRAGSLSRALTLAEDSPEVDDLGDGITADAMIPDLHLLPGLWKIDGYSKVANTILSRFDVVEGQNFFRFPYDWRRDNRVAARRLRRQSHDWLRDWRGSSGNRSAKLILIAHSMGGLVSRYFVEVLEGWKDTRALISFGTPYRGSLNSLDNLANGVRKGPFGLFEMTEMVRSFTSVYQLLPTYECYDAGDGRLVRVGETSGIPNVDSGKAGDALAFHREIEAAVEAHLREDDYVRNGYRVHPIVGLGQQTLQSARLGQGRVDLLTTHGGADHSGDGTVPRVSATPLEYSRERNQMYAATQHSSLQNAGTVLTQIDGLISSFYFDLGSFRGPSPVRGAIALEIQDLYWRGEPIRVRARPERKGVQLSASLVNGGSERTLETLALRPGEDGWYTAEFGPPAPGTYRVVVGGDKTVNPVTDALAVADAHPGDLPADL
jgi:hypothetical protein